MRELLVVGGDGNMTGMCADRISDDMVGLLSGLSDTAQYYQVIFHFSPRFLLPPDNPESLIPYVACMGIVPKALMEAVGEDEFRKTYKSASDEDLLRAARGYPEILHRKILKEATAMALAQLYETVLSFAGGRQIVLIPDAGNDLCSGLLPFFSPTQDDGLQNMRIKSAKLPVTSGISEWPLVFNRFKPVIFPQDLLPGNGATLSFPWGIDFSVSEPLSRCRNILTTEVKVSYPAEDVLKHPRALLVRAEDDGFLLAIPRPDNMRNFSITLRTGKGLGKEDEPVAVQKAGKAPKVERNWMTRDEAAAAIKKSADTVDNYCRDGKLESYKVGREVRISKASVQAYLDRGKA